MPGACCRSYNNLGANKPWDGFIDKVSYSLPVFQKLADRHPDKIHAIMDGGDIAFGGCSNHELMSRYHNIVKASGGLPVVVGADSYLFPDWEGTMRRKFDLPEATSRRNSVLEAFGLDPDAYGQYYGGTTPFGWGKGDYKFVNSGFVMGPAWALAKVFECMSKVPGRGNCGVGCFDDQNALIHCSLEDAKDLITIDYSGSLVLTSSGLNFRQFISGSDGLIFNSVTGLTQCFLHVNYPDPFPLDYIKDLVVV